MTRERAIILTNNSNLGDIFITKVFHKYPDAEINYWRSGAFSIQELNGNCFELEPPTTDFELFNFWESSVRDKLKKQFNIPYFYIVEFADKLFFTDVMSVITDSSGTHISVAFITDEKAFLKYIKKNIKR